ncbi:MAG: DNA polymerase Y family protein [Planctomycetaceae bacterium]
MCVWLPNWPLQRIRSAQPEHRDRAIVLYRDAGRGGLRVVTCCRAAGRRGIVAGMPLAEAKGTIPPTRRSQAQPLFVLHEPREDEAALRRLAVWCRRFSPLVGIEPVGIEPAGLEEPDSLLLDLSGCAHLFGGERRLFRQLSRSLGGWGASVRIAVADTIGAAWAVAHFGRDRTTVVPPGEQAAALRSLPVQSLRLPATAVETLHELDICRVEQLQALPRGGLAPRFGPEPARRLDQALGNVAEQIEPVRPPEPIEAGIKFEHPAGNRRALEAALRRLVERIAEKLSASGQGAQQLEVHLVETKRETRFTVGMLRPCRSASYLMELVQTQLERTTIRGDVAEIRVKTTATARLSSYQDRLFDSGENPGGQHELAQLIDRLSNRLGNRRVVRPVPRPDAQPEFAVRWEPLLKPNGQPESQQLATFNARPASARPLRLRTEPLAVEVVSVVPEGPPIRFFGKAGVHMIARCWGPERIETGWWRDRHVRRDYYRVETASGRRFWLFRRIDQGDWFLHGEFE